MADKRNASWGRKYPYEFAVCRSVTGHVWNLNPDVLPKTDSQPGFGWRFECSSCDTVKDVWYDRRTGVTTKTRYSYPEGYATKQPRAELRLDVLRQLDKIRKAWKAA